MKKEELKALIRPIVKECIEETLMESSLVSHVVAEVLKGTLPLMMENKKLQLTEQVKHVEKRPTPKVEKAVDKELLKEIASESYSGLKDFSVGGINIFEGVKPLSNREATISENSPKGALAGADPEDPGVDLSKFGIKGKIKQIRG